MELKIQLRLRQTLAPQLIQSLKMLQMPALKLEQLLRHELAINPLLEEIEPIEDQTEEVASPSVSDEDPKLDPQMTKIDWDYYLGDEADDYTFSRVREREETDERHNESADTDKTLYEHLLEQLGFLKLTPEEYSIGEFIIGNIDDSGYLTCPVDEMAELLKIERKAVEDVLAKIRKFDPPGVGAADLRESLLMQLEERSLTGSLAYRIVSDCFDTLDKKSHLQIAKALGTTAERVQEAMDLLRTLSPKPTSGRFDSAAMPIVPDLVVDKIGDDYVVYHNDKNIPQLRVNAAYRSLLKRGSTTESETKKYVREKLEQARWLINAINQRRTTMVRVMTAIVEEQKEFFEKGPDFLRPLIMENIAEKVSMNVATISRVSSDKYVQTPQGVYEIKYFFNTGLPRDGGEQVVKRSVKQKLEEIVRAEDTANPLSDQEIHKKLRDEGISIARRTVTKYREELKIQPARFRRRVGRDSC
jgi:RNA polymerase sigma-54 factor